VSRFAVDLQLLDALTGELADYVRRLDTVRGELAAQLHRLDAQWAGAAAAAQADAQQRWAQAARDMQTALGALQAIAATAGENYRAAGAASGQMWAR
jgi:WXG100 family type VII secretion target